MTYNTGNPVPSTDARDYIDNVENLDEAMNTLDATWTDRKGVSRTTWEGIVQGNGFFNVGTFAVGFTLTNSRQTLTYDGHEYGWSGIFPPSGYVVSAGSTPTPPGSGGWIDRTDVALRSELAATGGVDMVGGMLPRKICRTTTDIAAAISSGVADGTDCDIYMDGVVIASQIVIPSGIAVRFYGHATVAIDNAFVYEIGESNSTFRPIEFVSGSITATSAVHCVRIAVPWSSRERCPLIVHDGFEFRLSSGSCALHLTGGFFHKIDGAHRLDSTSHLVHFDVSPQQVGDTEPVSPMNLTFGCVVIGGNLFKYTKAAGTPFYHAEGVVLTDKFHSYACKIDAKFINCFINNAQLLESASTIIDSCPNSSFSPKYADMVANGDWMLKVKTSLGSTFNLSISPEILQSNTATGSQVLFTDEGNPGGFEIYNVSYAAAVQQGGGPSVGVYGVEFNHSAMRNFNADGRQCFSHMAAPYKFVQPLTRSSIAKFEARDVGAYATGLSTAFISSWSSYYNRFPSLYDEFDVVFTIPTFIGNGTAEEIMSTHISWPTMQRAPIITQFVSGAFPAVDGPTLTITSYEGGATVSLVKSTSMTTPGRAKWSGVLSINATAYVAPR